MAFEYKFPLAPSDPNCKSSFARGFQHKDWVDGQDVVQAEPTAEEEGLNARFHKIERDLDALGENLTAAFACIQILRGQLAQALVDIRSQFNAKPVKENKESKDFKDGKDQKDGKDGKDGKEAKDQKDAKDGKDSKDQKDGKDGKDTKESKDHKDHKDGKDGKDHPEKIMGAAEKQLDNLEPILPPSPMSEFLWRGAPDAREPAAPGRTFIRPDERPVVGGRALAGAAVSDADLDDVLARVGDALAGLPVTRAELSALASALATRTPVAPPPDEP